MELEKAQYFQILLKNMQERHTIERETILQSNCQKWVDIRSQILTASNFGKICRSRPTSKLNIVKNLIYKCFESEATKYGKIHERDALEMLEKQEQIVIEGCGLFIDKEFCFLGASPDGIIIGSNGIVEVKCCYSVKGLTFQEAIATKKLKFLSCDQANNYSLKKTHCYYYQIQGQLHITGKDYCLFGVYNESPGNTMFVQKIFKDDQFWDNKMLPHLQEFLNEYFLPEILKSRFNSRN